MMCTNMLLQILAYFTKNALKSKEIKTKQRFKKKKSLPFSGEKCFDG